jgi:indolepyruvate ferredoxin oxidoreductase beta subunit
MSDAPKTINLLIAALGGEGGGVLTNWLIDIADACGWHCQSTSLAGVAQRTGATIYYLEFMRRDGDNRRPVMSLFPAQGDIDIALTSEIAEAGRMVSRGFISPDRTTLISSDHRVFGITEKTHMGDGAADRDLILAMSARYAKRFIHFDMAELVKRHGTVISAGMLGALAGSGVLPFERQGYEKALQSGGGATANLSAFSDAYERAARGGVGVVDPAITPEKEAGFVLPEPRTDAGRALLPIIASLPAPIQEVVYYGAQKLVDFQDTAYAMTYLQAVEGLLAIDAPESSYESTREAARWLALWMAFEDIPRVAQLKLRPSRDDSLRQEAGIGAAEPMKVSEYFHPRVEEVASLLPRRIGEALLRSRVMRKLVNSALGARQLRTDTIVVTLALRGMAALRHVRRHSLGYHHEWRMITAWLDAIRNAPDPEVARALVDCGGMVKGYGSTRHRTTSRLMLIVDKVAAGKATTAHAIHDLRIAAMASEEEQPFQSALATLSP